MLDVIGDLRESSLRQQAMDLWHAIKAAEDMAEVPRVLIEAEEC